MFLRNLLFLSLLLAVNFSQLNAQFDVPDMSRANTLLSAGKITELKQLCDSVLNYVPGSLLAGIWSGVAHSISGESDQAVRIFEKLSFSGARMMAIQERMGRAVMGAGNHKRALAIFSYLVEGGLLTANDLNTNPVYDPVRELSEFEELTLLAKAVEKSKIEDLDLEKHQLNLTARLGSVWKDNWPQYDLTSVVHVRPGKTSGKSPLLIWLNPGSGQNAAKSLETFHKQTFDIWAKALPEDWTIASGSVLNLSKIDFENWGLSSGEGVIMVEEVLKFLKDSYAIDERKVFLGGYADAAHMVFHFVQSMPDQFAGFVSFGGHPAALDAIKLNSYVVNYRHANLLAYSSKNDTYSNESYAPYRNTISRIAPNVVWNIQEQPTNLKNLGVKAGEIYEWMTQQELDHFPHIIDWQTGNSFLDRKKAFWVRIDELSNPIKGGVFDKPNLPSVEFNPKLIWVYRQLADSTVPLIRVFEHGALYRAGLRRGDALVSINGHPLSSENFYLNTEYFYSENQTKTVPIKFIRDGIIKESSLTLGSKTAIPFYNSDKGSRIRVEKKKNDIEVKAEGIGRFTLFISPEMFDINQIIRVTVNEKVVFGATVTPLSQIVLENGELLENTALIKVDVTK